MVYSIGWWFSWFRFSVSHMFQYLMHALLSVMFPLFWLLYCCRHLSRYNIWRIPHSMHSSMSEVKLTILWQYVTAGRDVQTDSATALWRTLTCRLCKNMKFCFQNWFLCIVLLPQQLQHNLFMWSSKFRLILCLHFATNNLDRKGYNIE